MPVHYDDSTSRWEGRWEGRPPNCISRGSIHCKEVVESQKNPVQAESWSSIKDSSTRSFIFFFLQGDPLGERWDRSSTHPRSASSGAVFSSRRGLRLRTSRTWSSIERVNYLEVGGLSCSWTDGDHRAAVAKEGLVRIGLVRMEGLIPKKLNEGLLLSVGWTILM